MLVRNLSPAECGKIVSENRFGRLACAKDGQPYISSIYYAYADEALYVFSVPGRKIDWMRANPKVCVLVEEEEADGGWRSVMIEGHYEELPDRIGHKRERDHAWSLLSKHAKWWEPGGLKPGRSELAEGAPHIFFRIAVDSMSGREALEGEAPR